ncbi:ABC transporter permease subunit [Yeguia hominis]|uniref:Sugar ABC transporter permease n=1 Tax=Yeguia hominis TaxID=2763662 RepID=A0A926HM48_9FIRM|nr:sugar ABC transporter permease [Yeguia hominis]
MQRSESSRGTGKRKAARLESKRLGYFLTIPSSILILAISFYPLIQGISLSFESYNLMKPKKRKFVGFDNFKELLFSDNEFHSVLFYSFVYTIAVVLLAYVFGLFLAMLLKRDIKGRGIYRTLVLLPWVVAPSIAAINWLWLLNDQIGFINNVLQKIGLISKPILFIAEPKIAQITVIFTSVWRSFPFMLIVVLAGLQSIPKDLYESAYIDGAGFWKSFFHITMPMIRGVSTVCIILQLIWTFNNFENIYLLTNGGPNDATYTLPILTYFTAFFRSKIGYASAIATLMLVVLLVISLIYLKIQKNRENG